LAAQLAVAADAGTFGALDSSGVEVLIKVIEIDILDPHWFG
jgi:hypothetical protein